MSVPSGSLTALVHPGMRIALGDGVGSPRAVTGELCAIAARAPDIRLLLGWMPVADPGLDPRAFADVRTVVPGWGLRHAVEAGLVRAVPARLAAVPALLAGPLRPDLLVATLVPHPAGGFTFGTEVSWLRAAVDAGARIAGVLSRAAPRCDAGPPLPGERIVIVADTRDPPSTLTFSAPSPRHRAIAERVAALVPEGSRLQVGPGALGGAVLEAIRVPVRIDSGLLPDQVAGLDRRGLLLGEAVGTYLAGGPELLEWAGERPLLHRIEHTHDLGRLCSGGPFIAVNTALEIDYQGQVNVEGLATAAVGGIGGHPDYAVAGARCVGGLSIIALPATHQGQPTLVSRLSLPVSTPGHDVDIVVTEHGAADLRGLDRAERARALAPLWEPGNPGSYARPS